MLALLAPLRRGGGPHRGPGEQRRPRLLVAHPSPDVYGSDRQLVETVRAAVDAGWHVVVVVPRTGPLVPLLEAAGAFVRTVPGPVLRRSTLTAPGLVGLLVAMPAFAWRALRTWRAVRPDRVLVNTLTIPWWLAVARVAGAPAVCHVHEAEAHLSRPVRRCLTAPLRLAGLVVANSRSTADLLLDGAPTLAARTRVVYNGVPAPATTSDLRPRRPGDPLELVLVSRLSPRKGIGVALDAVAALRAGGRPVRLRLCGSVFPGYEWFEAELRARAAEPDLAGAVEFAGYVADPHAELARADVALFPSFGESFGNVAVEALLAGRPLVASRVQGLTEIVRDGLTGVLVPPGDPVTLAAAIGRLADEPAAAAAMAARGSVDAHERFSLGRYHREMVECLGVVPGCRREHPAVGRQPAVDRGQRPHHVRSRTPR